MHNLQNFHFLTDFLCRIGFMLVCHAFDIETLLSWQSSQNSKNHATFAFRGRHLPINFRCCSTFPPCRCWNKCIFPRFSLFQLNYTLLPFCCNICSIFKYFVDINSLEPRTRSEMLLAAKAFQLNAKSEIKNW